MSVIKKEVDSVSAIITVTVGKDDYQEQVTKQLKEIRRKAAFPGFRPGNVPMGIIKKKYEKGIIAEEVNKSISDQLNNYIKEEKLSVLGSPLPSKSNEGTTFDFETAESFDFSFDVALEPAVDATVSKSDSVNYYEIKVDDETINKQIEGIQRQFGKNETLDGPSQEGDIVRGNLAEQKENGLILDNIIILSDKMTAEDEKKKFQAASKDQVIVFDLMKAFNGDEQEVRYMLNLPKEEDLSKFEGAEFSFTITEISRFVKGDINQEAYDKLYGEGVVKTEEEFHAKVQSELKNQLAMQSDYKLGLDVRKYLLNRVGEIAYPVELLKRMMVEANNIEPEKVDEEFEKSIEELTWMIVKGKIGQQLDVVLTQQDMLEYAKLMAREQFVQYGMNQVPDDLVEKYAQDILKDKKSLGNIQRQAEEQVIVKAVREAITLNSQSVTMEEFNDLFKKENMPEAASDEAAASENETK